MVGDVRTIDGHLAGQPDFAVDLYRRFIDLVEAIGLFTYSIGKTRITLKGERRGFAGWLGEAHAVGAHPG